MVRRAERPDARAGGTMTEEATLAARVDRAAAFDRLLQYHHRARIRLGCSAHPVGAGSIESSRSAASLEADSAASVEVPDAPIVVYTHRDLPWRYFNHAAIYRRDAIPCPALIEEAADRMQRAGRTPCFDLPMDATGMTPPVDAEADRVWEERARRWSAELQRRRFLSCDRLLAMARPLNEESGFFTSSDESVENFAPADKPRYGVILMPRDDLGRQIKLHRAGFEVARGRPQRCDRLVIQTNLTAGVEYLWAMDLARHQPVGSAALLTAAGVTELFALSVIPRHRGCGAGSQLTRASIRRAIAQGSSFIYLETEPDSRASSLYRRYGFVPIWSRISFVREG